jgi:RecA-family ATPase
MPSPQLIKLPGLDEEAINHELRFPPLSELIPSEVEFQHAELAPPCIVENYLWEDVGLLFAPGGTGKTTLIAYEAVCIALGRPLWGLKVASPGKTLIISAEDTRMILLARLRAICHGLNLSENEVRLVRESVVVLDVTTKFVKFIEDSSNKGISVSADINSICTAYSNQNIKVVIVDPAISFGIGESRINDNEQGLIMAGRTLVRSLNACVRYIHHTGKAGGDKEKPQSQYSGRGGSAFADGCRMVAGISPCERSSLPMGLKTQPTSTSFLLARHKTTYCAKQADLFIIRDGYAFSYASKEIGNASEIFESQKRQIQNWVYQAERSRNLLLARTAIEEGYLKEIGIKREDFRSALAQLISEQIIVEMELPANMKKGAKKYYLHAIVDSSMAIDSANPIGAIEK